MCNDHKSQFSNLWIIYLTSSIDILDIELFYVRKYKFEIFIFPKSGSKFK